MMQYTSGKDSRRRRL